MSPHSPSSSPFPIDPASPHRTHHQIQLGTCRLDLDPGLCDRLHCTLDALASAQQTSADIVLAIVETSDSVSTEGESEDDARVRKWLGTSRTVSDVYPIEMSALVLLK